MRDEGLEREITLMHGRVCSGIADPARVLILYALDKGPLCVGELVRATGMSQPAVSRHLRVLRERGLVATRRRGQSIDYRIADRRVIKALDLLRGVLATQLEREQAAVERRSVR